jgi:RNA polymerase subunit RPABC4/transcription elongation factor Spt4
MDREKVIKGLECCNQVEEGCEVCPYYNDFNGCMLELREDALAMLKEQEAVEPKAIRMNAFGHPVYACGKCGHLITESMNYCHECGKRIKWEGR